MMNYYCTPEFFAANRRELRRQLPSGALCVIPSAGLLQRTGDTSFPFVQDSNFWYLTGSNHPDMVLVISPIEEYIITATRSVSRQTFDGSIDFDEVRQATGGVHVFTAHEGWQRLKAELHTYSCTLYAPSVSPAYSKAHGMFTNPHRRKVIEKCRRLISGAPISSCTPQLTAMRAVKQPAELQALQAAITMTTTAIDQVREHFLELHYEYEVEALLSKAFRTGGEGHGFAPIVANGKQATTLHYTENNGPLLRDTLTVIDVGASVEHYSADVTRTIARGTPTPRQMAIHQAVLEVQQFAMSELRVGTLLRDYEAAVRGLMAKKLLQLGLLTSVAQTDLVDKYYPHATSHFLGLDVHDVGDYSAPLTENMVLTCEPGIYIPEEGIGVRIEDDVVITKHGSRVFSECTVAL